MQVLCPRWEAGSSLKKKMKKSKGECASSGKKKLVKLESMSDVERALTDSKDSASAVSALVHNTNTSENTKNV